jgi:HlyD family secretion protein
MARSNRHRAVIVVALLVLGVTVLILRPPRVPVDTVAAARGRLMVTVDEEGETRVRDRYLITAPVAGRLQRIALEEGDPVEQGTVVAQMNPLPLDPRVHAEATARVEAAEAAKREADARVEEARAAHAQATREARRMRALGGGGIVAAEAVERAALDEVSRAKQLEAAQSAARAAEYAVVAARAALLAPGQTSTLTVCAEEQEACVALRAPATGQVLRVLEESERVVEFGTPLLEIGDPSKLEIVVDVLSSDAVKVTAGDRVLVHDWGGEQELEARVRLVEPSGFTKVSALGVEEQRVNVIADFLDPPHALGDGYRLEARIVVWSGDVLKIPSSALFRHRGRWSVFVVEGGRARRREVEVGHVNSFEVEVAGGLTAGEVVVEHPSDQVDDGTRVRAT